MYYDKCVRMPGFLLVNPTLEREERLRAQVSGEIIITSCKYSYNYREGGTGMKALRILAAILIAGAVSVLAVQLFYRFFYRRWTYYRVRGGAFPDDLAASQ